MINFKIIGKIETKTNYVKEALVLLSPLSPVVSVEKNEERKYSVAYKHSVIRFYKELSGEEEEETKLEALFNNIKEKIEWEDIHIVITNDKNDKCVIFNKRGKEEIWGKAHW